MARTAEALKALILADPQHVVSRSIAVKHEAITAKSLDALMQAQPDRFKELTNFRKAGNNKILSKAYILVGATVQQDEEEARADAVSALQERTSDMVDATLGAQRIEMADNAYRAMVRKAKENLDNPAHGRPSIPLSGISPALDLTLVTWRYQQTMTRVTKYPGAKEPEIWFRKDPDGNEMVDWSRCYPGMKGIWNERLIPVDENADDKPYFKGNQPIP